MKNLYIVLTVMLLVSLFVFTRSIHALSVGNADVKAKWEKIEGPLARRNDLIRDLLNAAKGSTMSEEPGLKELDSSRSKWINMNTLEEKVGGANAVDIALSRVLAAVADYPDLKGKEAFSKVMNELTGVENRIAIEKIKYNEAVRGYNLKVRNFPSSIIANLFGYKLAVEYPNIQ